MNTLEFKNKNIPNIIVFGCINCDVDNLYFMYNKNNFVQYY